VANGALGGLFRRADLDRIFARWFVSFGQQSQLLRAMHC